MATQAQPRKNLIMRVWSIFDANERYLRTIQPLVGQINALEPEFETLTQQDLRDRLRKIRAEVEETRAAMLKAQDELPPAEDSDTRRRRHKDVVAAEKAILDQHLVEVFAAVREAAKRTLSMRHFDVQLLGGIVLHEGRIAEMKTGEGKTLTATCPLVLNALAGRGAHVVTVNDYLARRDAEWMGKIYRYLGLSVGVIQHDLDRVERQTSYGCDITYITNHEIGFDYLRDHSSAWRPEHLVIRELHYAIIDEVDSILIDEARVPLIISASRGKPVEKYRKVQEIVSRLILGERDEETKETTGDLYIDEKAKNATLTEDGQRKCEIAMGIDNLNDSAHIEDMHLVNAALKANFCYKRDVDYIVGPGDEGPNCVVIVDTFTGRPQPGRRWSDGLHQAIEAKERVPIQDEQQTIATVTYQNFFLMYNRLSGMTGTAKTEEAEFVGIYEMPVVVVPTNKPMRRIEHQDVVYKTEEWKFRGICTEIIQYFLRRQPVLVGTRSVETSERVSARLRADRVRLTLQLLLFQWHIMENEKRIDKALLKQLREASTVPLESLKPREVAGFLQAVGLDPEPDSDANFARLREILEVEPDNEDALRDVIAHGVPHEVLNARYHEREAQIVAQAGRLGAITIATNMAGRGTDIVLGGNPEPDVEGLLLHRGIDPKSLEATLFINQALKGAGDGARGQAEEFGGLPAPVLREIAEIRSAWSAENDDVVTKGGLHILGTERHESRRIDNQLRGRSARQGDPGSARFYISLQDELMRLFGPERWGMLMNQWPEEQPVEAKLITRAMNNAQKKVEGRNFGIRKDTLRFDDVMNIQRQHIYAERRRILEGVDLRNTVSTMMAETVDEEMGQFVPGDSRPEEWDLPGLWQALNQRFPLKDQIAYEDLLNIDREALRERLRAAAERSYDDKENDFIRSVVEFELQASIHETLEQVPDRDVVCQVLNTLWPLEAYLPGRLQGVPDARVPETLFAVVREALEAGPRDFIVAVVRDRLHRDAGAAADALAAGEDPAAVAERLRAAWPLKLESRDLADPAAVEAQLVKTMEQGGWTFVKDALHRQMAATVELLLPQFCDLPALVDAVDSLWPLGGGLDARQLESANYGVVEDRLERLTQQAIEQFGYDFVGRAADHRLRWAAEAHADDADGLAAHLATILPTNVRTSPSELPADAEGLVDALFDDATDGLILRAVEEVAAQATIEAHRQMSASPDEDADEEEELAFGDLNRLVERLTEQWAFGDALNAWELERLAAGDVRREMAESVRQEVRSRGMAFVTDTALLRLRGQVRAAIRDHYSLPDLCARLNQAIERPAAFDVEELTDVESTQDLLERLREAGAAALEDEPEAADAFVRALPAVVQEGYNLKRVCDRLNTELNPKRKLDPRDLADLPSDELEGALLERLQEVEQAYLERFILDAVRQHVGLTLREALDRYYDLRSLSTALAAAWPLRPDAVRPSKLKGWVYNELERRLKDLLSEACRWEEWRFTRRFVMRLLSLGLEEAAAYYCPAGTRQSAWDLAGLCADIASRWPLEEEPDPRALPEFSREMLLDELLSLGRRAYGLHERAFVRDTARHRYGQTIDQIRREHYSLGRAAMEVNSRWLLGGAIEPLALADVRANPDEAAVRRLVDPVSETAEAAFLQDSVDRRIMESVQDVLGRHYNPASLLQEVLGRWPLPEGGLQPEAMYALPYRDLVDRVRAVFRGAGASLQRRTAFHNLRAAAAEVDRSILGADPAGWPLGALTADLAGRLPFEGAAEAGAFAGDLLVRALGEAVAAAAAETDPARGDVLRGIVRERAAEQIDRLVQVEGRPQARVQRLAALWPVGDRLNPDTMKGQTTADARAALNRAVDEAVAADPQRFLAGTTALWLTAGVDEVLDRYWPGEKAPGPWVLAQVTGALNERWGQPELLHPTDYKGLERDVLRDKLLKVAAGLELARVTPVFTAGLVREVLEARIRQAARQHTGERGWDLPALVAEFTRDWPGRSAAPTAAQVAARLTDALVAVQLAATAESLEPRMVAEYESEPVQTWIERRLDRALSMVCSLAAVCDELARRWPIEGLDAGRLSSLTYAQVRDALLEAGLRAAHEGGPAFVGAAARARLRLDIQDLLAALPRTDEGRDAQLDHLLGRWPWEATRQALLASPQTAAAQLETAAAGLDEATLERVFLFETVERRLGQAVAEAQWAHANPEIASDRWDLPALVAALEHDWPVDGRLRSETLAGLDSEGVRERAHEAMVAAFRANEAAFIGATTARQVGNTLRAAVAEHADLERLCALLTESWPREGTFEPATVRAEMLEELEPELKALVLPVYPDADVAGFLAGRAVSADDLDGLLAAVRRQWPDVREMSAAELDERLVREYLLTRLWREFQEDPRAFVKAVALEDVPRQLERRLMLEAIDTNWCNHLEAMDYLKEGINLRGYAQTDPFIAYRKDGRLMFENMLGRVREMIVAGLFETTEHQIVEMHAHGRLGLQIAVEFQNVQEMAAKAEDITASHTPQPAPGPKAPAQRRQQAAGPAPQTPGVASATATAARAPVVVEKVGRNDPCPCGSGKKYKHCCGKAG